MDCLVTKLKASVDNNNLPVFGCVSFDLTENAVFNPIKFVGATEAYIVGNGYFSDSTGSSNLGKVNNTPGSNFYIKASNGDKLYVKFKYDITEIWFFENSNGRIIKENSTIDLSFCHNITAIRVSKYDVNVNLNLNEFTKTNHVVSFIRYHFNPLLEGDIETMVENMIEGGRNSGTLTIAAAGSGLKLNGIVFMTGSLEAIRITFNSASNVTVYEKEDGSGNLLASYDGSTWTYA